MAKYYSSTFGAISGKHGTAVAVRRKDGTTYLRLHVKPSNPRTDKQQAHRAKFALASKALVPFNPIFKKTMGITNGISKARSYAFNNAIVGEYPNFEMDYKKLMFSFGTIEKLENTSVTINEGIMTINWSYEERHNSYGDDSVCLVLFNKDTNQAVHLEDIANRAEMETKIDIYDSWADSDLYLWAYVMRGDKYSDSVYVEEVAYEITSNIHKETTHTDAPSHCEDKAPTNKGIKNYHMNTYPDKTYRIDVDNSPLRQRFLQ